MASNRNNSIKLFTNPLYGDSKKIKTIELQNHNRHDLNKLEEGSNVKHVVANRDILNKLKEAKLPFKTKEDLVKAIKKSDNKYEDFSKNQDGQKNEKKLKEIISYYKNVITKAEDHKKFLKGVNHKYDGSKKSPQEIISDFRKFVRQSQKHRQEYVVDVLKELLLMRGTIGIIIFISLVIWTNNSYNSIYLWLIYYGLTWVNLILLVCFQNLYFWILGLRKYIYKIEKYSTDAWSKAAVHEFSPASVHQNM